MKAVMNLKISISASNFLPRQGNITFTRTLLHLVRHNSVICYRVLSNSLSFPSDSPSKILHSFFSPYTRHFYVFYPRLSVYSSPVSPHSLLRTFVTNYLQY